MEERTVPHDLDLAIPVDCARFHTGIAEPSYLLKYPAGVGIRDLLGILRAFHVL